MEHQPDPAIFESEPEPAMRRADAAIAAAHAHATDPEVRELLESASALVRRAYERQLALQGRARFVSGVYTVPKSTVQAERAPAHELDPAEDG